MIYFLDRGDRFYWHWKNFLTIVYQPKLKELRLHKYEFPSATENFKILYRDELKLKTRELIESIFSSEKIKQFNSSKEYGL